MKKLTAIEWLLEVLNDQQLLKNYPIKMIDLAYEMEKQQMKDAWFDSTMQFDNAAEMNNKKLFDDYYDETFDNK